MHPSFLCIGGQKCGTSWLQENLRQHPQVWLPPIKEVHYFDRKEVGLFNRFFGTSKRMRKARAYAAAQFQAWLAGNAHELEWSLYYWLGPRNDNWYRGLFADRRGKITGEICPGYARLAEPDVAKVKHLMPDARIIYLLRNPIERSWSYAAQYFTSPRAKGRYRQLANVPPNVMQSFFERDAQGHSNYLDALEAWQSHFRDRLFIGFFDELEIAPEMLFRRIARFLNIDDSASLVPSNIAENRHPSRGSQIPDEWLHYVTRLHLPALKKMHAKLQTKETECWLKKAESAVSQTSFNATQPVSNEKIGKGPFHVNAGSR